jgi:polar amino acid transport system substrate-binding protein
MQDVLRDIAPTDRLRAAINLGNPVLAQLNIQSGEPMGVSVDLARELGRRLGTPVDLVTFDSAGKVCEALQSDAWDVAFLAIDPIRAAEINFTTPYLLIEGTYLVRSNSPIRSIEELDNEGVRIAVGKGAAYDLYLSRSLKKAELLRAPTSAAAIDLFMAEGLDAAAGVRQPLAAYARTHPGVRVIPGKFTAIQQAMGTPKNRPVGAAFLQNFIEEMKASGFVAAGLERSGQTDAELAPLNEEEKTMPRIKYQPEDMDKPEDLVASIRARRGGTLLNLDRMLLHSPPFAKGWNEFLREVRCGLSLSPKLRELAICGVAVLNGAEYEFHHHAPEFIKAGGTVAQVEALRNFETAANESDIFDAAECAVIQLTLEMTREVQVSDSTFASVKSSLPDDQSMVELVGVIAAYNMVSRFLVALGVKPEEIGA